MIIMAALQGPLIFTDEKHLGSERLLLSRSAITKYYRLGDLNNKYLFRTVGEAGSTRVRMLVWLDSGERSLPAL